jgi:hypothetical protein
MSINFLKKELVVKKLFVSALVVLGLTSLVSAQTSGQVAANLSVTIKQALSITESGSLNFGTAYPGYSVTPVAATASGVPLFTVLGEPSTAVTITLPASATLLNGTNSVTFTPSVNGGQTSAQASSSALTLGSPSETLSAGGNYYMWLGGQINNGNPLPSLLASGTYNGTYTIQVNY